MKERLNELVKRSTLLATVSVSSLLVDPTGSSGLLIGVLGNAAFEQIKKLGKAVSAFSPTQVLQPESPLNQALARAIAKALQFAVGPNTLKAFKATQNWKDFTPSEKEEIKEACRELQRVPAARQGREICGCRVCALLDSPNRAGWRNPLWLESEGC